MGDEWSDVDQPAPDVLNGQLKFFWVIGRSDGGDEVHVLAEELVVIHWIHGHVGHAEGHDRTAVFDQADGAVDRGRLMSDGLDDGVYATPADDSLNSGGQFGIVRGAKGMRGASRKPDRTSMFDRI